MHNCKYELNFKFIQEILIVCLFVSSAVVSIEDKECDPFIKISIYTTYKMQLQNYLII